MQIEKSNLGHYRKVMSEGDAESRETRRRFSRPKRKVKHMLRQGKLMTVRKVGKSKSFTQRTSRVNGGCHVKVLGMLKGKVR